MPDPNRKQSFYDREEGHYEYRGAQGNQRDWNVNDDFRPAQSQGQPEHQGGGEQRQGYSGEPPFQRPGKPPFRGPKGYKRSDARIHEDVNEHLAHQDHFDPSDVEVSVTNGEVTLTGSVGVRQEKYWAEELTDEVRGVTEIHNQLRVRRDRSDTMTAITQTPRPTTADVSKGNVRV